MYVINRFYVYQSKHQKNYIYTYIRIVKLEGKYSTKYHTDIVSCVCTVLVYKCTCTSTCCNMYMIKHDFQKEKTS